MSISLSNYFGKSIKRMVTASFIFVLLLPIGFFVYSLYQNSWQQVEQRMVEKHHLISEALVEPFTLFFSTRQEALSTLGQELLQAGDKKKSRLHFAEVETDVQNQKIKKIQAIQAILDKHQQSFGNFVALYYTNSADSGLDSISTVNTGHVKLEKLDYLNLSMSELPAVENNKFGKDLISRVIRSSISGKPVILIKHHIFDATQTSQGIIYAEVSLDQIRDMCSRINFGVLGHCAVVDNTGHAVAHPNKGWVQEIRNLSKVSIVKKMLAGETGTTVFYSPFLKADMVAGFSPIPALGWGVMIPQPKAELTKILDDARTNTLAWMLIGVAVALFVAMLLARKVTNPINLLISLTHKSDKNYQAVNIGEAPSDTPQEIKKLWSSFSNLLSGLQSSNKEINRLNVSLQEDIQQATAELQEVNKNLYITNNQDYLTSISNRRHFNEHLTQVLENKVGENIGIIMIDVDKFKHLNDHYGHEVGDLALVHLADILKRSIRPCDLVARLGGDEFIVYVQDPSDKALLECGEKIRENMERSPLELASETVPFTLSVGAANQYNTGKLSIEELLRFADKAMYDSKASGRNKVSTFQAEEPEVRRTLRDRA